MTQPARLFRLDEDPQGSGLSCDATGLRLAGVSLLRKDANGFAPRAPDEIEGLLACAYGEGPDTPRLTTTGLEAVARALNQGDLAKAMTAAVFLRLPDPDPNGAARIARGDELLAKWDGQPRSADGRYGQGKMNDAGAHQDRPAAQPARHPAPPPHVQVHGTTDVATAADFILPKTPADARRRVQFPPTLQQQFDAAWSRSFPGGRSKEQGGTIVADRQGNLSAQNIGGIYSDTKIFKPDYKLKDPSQFTVVGAFHTHPYDSSEHGFTGISLDGGDAGGFIDSPARFMVEQSGDRQFMFVKTEQTPKSFPWDLANNRGIALVDGLEHKGYTFQEAAQRAAKQIAQQYGFAYYEGSHGHFTRVYPE